MGSGLITRYTGAVGAVAPDAGAMLAVKDASGNVVLLQLDADGKLPVASTSGGGGGGAATVADGADVAEGAKADALATNNTSSWSVVALLKALWALVAQKLDYDTGAGTANQVLVGIALPASGGPVGVSPSNPLPSLSGLFTKPYDAVVISSTTTTDVFTYKLTDVSGTTVGTITITYTDTTKAVQQSVARVYA